MEPTPPPSSQPPVAKDKNIQDIPFEEVPKGGGEPIPSKGKVLSLADELKKTARDFLPPAGDSDFRQPTEDEKREAETQAADENQEKESTGSAQKVAADAVNMSGEKFTKAIVAVIDQVSMYGCKWGIESTAFTKEDKHALLELTTIRAQQKIKQGIDLTPYEDWLLRKHTEIMQYETEVLPLTADEKKDLAEYLNDIFKTKNIKGSPGGALAIIIVAILLPRILPILGNLTEKWFINKKPAYERTDFTEVVTQTKQAA